jgi:hypothetical protein
MAQTSGPGIVKDGLVVLLDAADKLSYPGTGTTWYDISGFSNHCSLPNTPGHYGTYFTFNGTSNYGSITSNSSSLDFSEEQSVMIVMQHTYTSGRKNPWNQAYGGYGTWTHEDGVNINYFYGDSGVDNTPYSSLNSGTTSTGVWNIMCVTRDINQVVWYKNGTSVANMTNPYGAVPYTTTAITIGSGYAGYWQGDMAIVAAYQFALTPGQILQNFNFLKNRFKL